jgi:orotidine-5'-phosphate decarboxylase
MTQYWPFSGLSRHGALRERVIVSLDFGDRREALKLVDRLNRMVGMFKVGRSLFMGGGPDFVREIRRRGAEVFLDLKFHDTPRNVLRAAIEATRLGVKMFDIHPSSSVDVMARLRTEVARLSRIEGLRRPHILAVTMLARLKSADAECGDSDRVAELARLAAEATLDGVFTSPLEVPRVRSTCGRRFLIVTSPLAARAGAEGANPCALGGADAIRAGADYLVIGSPVWRADEPVGAVRGIIEDIERALRMNVRGTLERYPPLRPI